MNRQIVNRRYRIERRIGEGGMAEVDLGFDIVLNRRVAIKWLRPQFAADRAFRLRFEREAQSAARFSHPNIIAIYDVGEEDGAPYIVMEYVDGQTLREIIDEEGPFHPDDVAILIEQVAAALDYAHARGVVHRDVKPQNILIDRHGLAKVVDFGIAKGLSDSTLTEAGSGLGTVHYASPEQASGLLATPESDIYSLGVVAYEMLTDRLPFESDTAVGVAMRHVNDPVPDPAELNPAIPAAVADVVLRALAKNPTRRFGQAGAFAAALSGWRDHQASETNGRGDWAVPVTAERASAPPPPDIPLAQSPTVQIDTRPATRSAPAPPPSMPVVIARRRRVARARVAAVAVAICVIGLFWYGFGVSGRLSDDDPPQPTATALQALVLSTLTPTSEPTAVPAEPTSAPTPRLAAVPRIVGLSRGDAESALAAAGLTFELRGEASSSTVANGAVISQDPAESASVEPGSVVSVTISTGPEPVDLAGLELPGATLEEATARLEEQGLAVETVEEGSDRIEAGRVIRAEPDSDLLPGDLVTLVVSAGDRVQIPVQLQGEPRDAVRRQLEELGLVVAGEVPVSEQTIREAGVDDLAGAGIENQDVVGIQDNGAEFGGWIEPGTPVTIVYFEAGDVQPTIGPAA